MSEGIWLSSEWVDYSLLDVLLIPGSPCFPSFSLEQCFSKDPLKISTTASLFSDPTSRAKQSILGMLMNGAENVILK